MGVLFVIATLGSVLGGSIIESVISKPEDLVNVVANTNMLLVGVLLTLLLAVAVVLIPAFLFPYLKKYSEKLALGYFGMRILEALTPIIDVVCVLGIITLAKSNGSGSQLLAGLLLGIRSWVFLVNPIIFGVGALFLYFLTYKTKLIPVWLSVWGFIGAVLIITAGIMGLFGNFLIVLALPIALQEMVMAGYLIVKGFNFEIK